MKYLALDIGEKRIGLAVSDESGIIARPLFAVDVGSGLMGKIGEVVRTEKPEKVIFGIPRHQSGEESLVAGQIREFAEGIKHEFGIEVDFEDESATSIEAEKRLRERKMNPVEIKENVDAEAAAVILESYLAKS